MISRSMAVGLASIVLIGGSIAATRVLAEPCSVCFVTVSYSTDTSTWINCNGQRCFGQFKKDQYTDPPCQIYPDDIDTTCVFVSSATLLEKLPPYCDEVIGCANQPSGTVLETGPGCFEQPENCTGS